MVYSRGKNPSLQDSNIWLLTLVAWYYMPAWQNFKWAWWGSRSSMLWAKSVLFFDTGILVTLSRLSFYVTVYRWNLNFFGSLYSSKKIQSISEKYIWNKRCTLKFFFEVLYFQLLRAQTNSIILCMKRLWTARMYDVWWPYVLSGQKTNTSTFFIHKKGL